MIDRALWVDGRWMRASEASVSPLAHSMQRGSSIFDVLSFHSTARGVAVFRLGEHVRRFLRSAAIVGLELQHDEATLAHAVCETVDRAALDEGLIRIVGYLPSLEADLVPLAPQATVAIYAYARSDLPKRPSGSPLRLAVSAMRKAAPDAIPPLAKVAAAYLGPMIARRAALEAGADEVVLLDHEGMIAEAPTANVFAVRSGTLVTPPLGAILDGITRATVLTLASEAGIPTVEQALSPEALRDADEAFLTATSYVVAPIGAIDGVAKAAPGKVTARIQAAVGETLAGQRWMTPVR
jgi:branched-chain amino acid aminotransferase